MNSCFCRNGGGDPKKSRKSRESSKRSSILASRRPSNMTEQKGFHCHTPHPEIRRVKFLTSLARLATLTLCPSSAFLRVRY